jgi:hypothetical protein
MPLLQSKNVIEAVGEVDDVAHNLIQLILLLLGQVRPLGHAAQRLYSAIRKPCHEIDALLILLLR